MTKVSIIIPIYNCELYIEKCLESLFAQTLEEIEFIFVDDCGTDDTVVLIKSFVSSRPEIQDKVILVSHTENKGVATARNTGLSIAKGEYIGSVDGDDWVAVDMFEQMYNKAKDENSEIVWCDYVNVYETNKLYISQQQEENSLTCIYAMMSGHLLGGMCNKLIKKKLFDRTSVRFPDGLNMCEDLRVNIQLFYYASRISYLSRGLYFYVKYNGGSVSTLSAKNQVINYSWIENVKGIVDFFEKNNVMITPLRLDIFKLAPKKNLLVRGRKLESFKSWRSIFPEANYSIRFTNYPIIYKLLAFVIDKEYWMFARLWLFVKYNLLKK